MITCDCVDVKIGSYENQVALIPPRGLFKSQRPICIDVCLAREIQELWAKGIKTTGCCCGHNIQEGYIGVSFEFIETMKLMGYNVQINRCRPEDEDSFVPQSLRDGKVSIPACGTEAIPERKS